MTWGDSWYVEHELKQGVDTIHASDRAFAAKMRDGSVVTWGDPYYGGDNGTIESEIKGGVEAIYSNMYAFTAKMTDGRIVTWGRGTTWDDESSNNRRNLLLQEILLPKLRKLVRPVLYAYIKRDLAELVLRYVY